MARYDFQQVTVPAAGGDVSANGINDKGQIVGTYITQIPFDPYPQTFLETNGSVSAVPLPFSGQQAGNAINNLGQIAGTEGDAIVGINGFLWSPDGTIQKVSSVTQGSPSGLFDEAHGLNDRGQVVGTDFADFQHHEGFLWDQGKMSFLQYPGAVFTDAMGISDTRTIVGFYSAGTLPDGTATPNHPFIDRNGHFSEIKVPGAASSEANGISPDGLEIVGTFQDAAGHSHGWTDIFRHISKVNVPGARDTWVNGVNDLGQLVGAYSAAGDPAKHGFVATPDLSHFLTS
jgi:uncharacterized membrane protein